MADVISSFTPASPTLDSPHRAVTNSTIFYGGGHSVQQLCVMSRSIPVNVDDGVRSSGAAFGLVMAPLQRITGARCSRGITLGQIKQSPTARDAEFDDRARPARNVLHCHCRRPRPSPCHLPRLSPPLRPRLSFSP